MIDIDHFKAFNDTFGHQAGDRILVTFASVLKERIRTQDFVSRYGGEEFCLLLPGTDRAGGVRLVEQLAHYPIHDDEGRSITFSAGVAEWQPFESDEDLLARADAALYRAKQSGRDRVEVAD
jgi:diguanylate cyclase (GGDEF)-like protein